MSSTNPEIAIVGMACRLPGADDLDAYWQLIRDGVSTAAPLPESKLNRSLYFDPRRGIQNRTYSDIACLVNPKARGRYFEQLPKSVRKCPEVAYRTLCDVAADALGDAQLEILPRQWRSGGVYLGHARSSGLSGDLAYATCVAQSAELLHQVERFRDLELDHEKLVSQIVSDVRREYPRRDELGGPQLGPHAAAAILANTFSFDGPAIAFNSACASSLNALHQAVLALQQGRIDVAMVAGASVCHFETLVIFSQAQSLSGVMSRPFDQDADGLILGEGYAVVILKTLEKARLDGDTIHAVIRGIGVSSDGKGKSLWAPRQEGQIEAVRRAYRGDIQPSDLQYIEAHATSTQLGDATEIAALSASMEIPADKKIPISSVKGNIGHTLETAGLSGLLKVVLSMRHQEIGPAANLHRLNDKIAWDSIPFYVPRQLEPWPEPAEGQPRRAAVNAFGIGGLNMHVVLEEFQTNTSRVGSTLQGNGEPLLIRMKNNSSTEDTDNAVAIIGRGTVLPGAHNIEQFADLLTRGIDPKNTLQSRRLNGTKYLDTSEAKRWHCTNNLVGEVSGFTYDWRAYKIPPKQIAQASPLQFMILDAVDQAYKEAGIDPQDGLSQTTGVVVGTPFGGEFSTQLLMGLRLPEFQMRLRRILMQHGCDGSICEEICSSYGEKLVKELPALLDETGSFTSSSLASRITKSFNLMGGGVAVTAGNCSSSAALACCVDQLTSRTCDLMICVGGQEDLSPSFLERMSLTGLLASGSPKSPLDAKANGSVPAEGCGALLLMRLDDARSQNREVLAIVRGIGTASGGSLSQASETAISRAFQAASNTVTPANVVRVETTSVANPPALAEEWEGLFHGYADPTRQTAISLDSMTCQTGHLGAAAAVTAVIKTSLELENQRTYPTFGLTETSPLIQSNSLFEVHRQATRLQANNVSGDQASPGRFVAAVHSAERQTAYHCLLERGAIVHAPNELAESPTPTYSSKLIDDITVVDATLQRRIAMREQAMRQSSPMSSNAANVSKQRVAPIDDQPETPISTPVSGQSRSTPQQPKVAAQMVTVTTDSSGELSEAELPSESDLLSESDLKEFLVCFIVEQTGYPSEFVEMEADLEADLGIDSIKKAQMFGELGERFSITADETLTLDDFPTLRHIFDFLAKTNMVTASTTEPSRPQPPAPVLEAANVKAQLVQPSEDASPLDQSPVEREPEGGLATGYEPTSPTKSKSDLQAQFLHFISEQTGYPVPLLVLSARLEADLGINETRQEELIRSLRMEFGLTSILPDRNGFKTLQNLFDLVAAQPTPTAAPQSNPAAPQKAQPDGQRPNLIPEYEQLRRTKDLLAMAGLSIPYFAEHQNITGDTAQVDGKQVISFGSTNYLGMSGDPIVAAGATDAIAQYGTSVSASRLIAGKPLHRELEQELAAFLGAEATLAFSSGYAANESTIGHLFGPGDLIIHDALAHNCIIQGAVLSGAQRLNFPHNDCEALAQQLDKIGAKYRKILIAIEGAYSMDGDFPDLHRILEIKRQYHAFLLVDDAHSVGTMGRTGRGSPDFFGVHPSEIDLWVGTLSKALGSGGGFVAGSRDLIDYLKHSTPGFIYTDALPPASAGAALASLRLLQKEPQRVHRLQENARILLQLAKQHGLDTRSAGQTPIVPIMVGNSHTALLLSKRLLERGIDIQPIVYPAVENDASRLRFMVTAEHTEAQIRTAIDALAELLKEAQAESVPIDQWKAALRPHHPQPESAHDDDATGATAKPTTKPAANPAASQPTEPVALPHATNQKEATSSEISVARPTDVVVEPKPTIVSNNALVPRPPVQIQAKSTWTEDDLRTYLINFIVEQTGYPPEFVEMEADMEADLGIDSIKKAQLFGELGQQFAIEADETLTLDDFPTLQQVFDYISAQIGVNG